jgi:PBP1b-binding outer membrane lipoprotein LpoB
MQGFPKVYRYAAMSVTTLILAGCSNQTNQKEPAQKLITAIESTLAASATDESKYAADKLFDVQYRLGRLKFYFDNHEYEAVVAVGPEVLKLAQGLVPLAAAERSRIYRELNEQWTGLAASLPGEVAAIHARMDLLSQKANAKQAQGLDLEAAKTGAGEANALWTKAQAAFAAGTLGEAVSVAKDAQEKVAEVAASLKLELPKAAAPGRAAGQ